MGRPAAPGRVYDLGRVRWMPGDPPELREFLEMLERIEGRKELGRKARIVKAALCGGMAQGQAQAVALDGETAAALDELLEL